MSEAVPAGRLPDNILYFARALREAGLPVGPGSVLDALAAVEAARIGDRGRFLHGAARSLRKEARPHDHLPPGLRHLLAQARLCRKAARADVADGGSEDGEGAEGRGRRHPRRRRPPQEGEPGAQGGAVARPRRALHDERRRGAAAQGFRADERRRDRPRQGTRRAAAHAKRRRADAPPGGRPQGAD